MEEKKETDLLNGQGDLTKTKLELERTKLSLERTFLSYTRTALTLLVAGVSLIQFFENETFRYIGYVLVAFSIILFLLGIFRTRSKKKKLELIMSEDEDD